MTQRCNESRQGIWVWLLLVLMLLCAVKGLAADAPPATLQMTRQASDPNNPTPLKLDDAVLIALENHPSLKAARERIAAQRAVLGQQMDAYIEAPPIGATSARGRN